MAYTDKQKFSNTDVADPALALPHKDEKDPGDIDFVAPCLVRLVWKGNANSWQSLIAATQDVAHGLKIGLPALSDSGDFIDAGKNLANQLRQINLGAGVRDNDDHEWRDCCSTAPFAKILGECRVIGKAAFSLADANQRICNLTYNVDSEDKCRAHQVQEINNKLIDKFRGYFDFLHQRNVCVSAQTLSLAAAICPPQSFIRDECWAMIISQLSKRTTEIFNIINPTPQMPLRSPEQIRSWAESLVR